MINEKETSLDDSVRRINTPQNLVIYLHSAYLHSCSNNELAFTESVNSEEAIADNNTLPTHADIQTPLTINTIFPV